jgi:glycosyltransferase involved in cell wall biosynthesis
MESGKDLRLAHHLAVVIPAYKCADEIVETVTTIPEWVRQIVVVDDGSPDDLADRVRGIGDARVRVVQHDRNKGVGAAFITGCREALDLGADILVKMDGDGQMDPRQLQRLIRPIADKRADYTKGNRFWDLTAIRSMPWIRIFGNMALSLLLKLASGYWNLFDPTNGYIAITAFLFENINKKHIDEGYFFESSLLIEAGIHRFVVADVPMPAVYKAEKSFLSIRQALFRFPPRILHGIFRRFVWQYMLFDFTAVSVFVLVGLPATLWGVVFGAAVWHQNARAMQATPTGTIMLAVLPIIIGIQLISQAVVVDIGNTPKQPRTPFPESMGQ